MGVFKQTLFFIITCVSGFNIIYYEGIIEGVNLILFFIMLATVGWWFKDEKEVKDQEGDE